ncbi:winged helix-turn-helix domain-containing protein [Candidatus Saccharibacteria bacterium]|nr:winged helix-turn-helix domain-containing protein [Candidatus Saccharibacteria bacterium]
MKKKDIKRIAQLFRQTLPLFDGLGHPVRQKLMMLMLEDKPHTVAELAAKIGMSRPSVSHHLRVMLENDMIIAERVGRKTYYRPMVAKYIAPLQGLIDELTGCDSVDFNKQTHLYK